VSLYAATRDLHHACEAHPLGQRMSAGTVSSQQWADWLAAFRAIHAAMDPHLDQHLARVAYLDDDLGILAANGILSVEPKAARIFSESLTDNYKLLGAAYVLHGAHRRGGAVLAKRMGAVGLPTLHVNYPLPQLTEVFIKDLRMRYDLVDAATAAFQALLSSMGEIWDRTSSPTQGES